LLKLSGIMRHRFLVTLLMSACATDPHSADPKGTSGGGKADDPTSQAGQSLKMAATCTLPDGTTSHVAFKGGVFNYSSGETDADYPIQAITTGTRFTSTFVFLAGTSDRIGDQAEVLFFKQADWTTAKGNLAGGTFQMTERLLRLEPDDSDTTKPAADLLDEGATWSCTIDAPR
jgi:hypothetical protein